MYNSSINSIGAQAYDNNCAATEHVWFTADRFDGAGASFMSFQVRT